MSEEREPDSSQKSDRQERAEAETVQADDLQSLEETANAGATLIEGDELGEGDPNATVNLTDADPEATVDVSQAPDPAATMDLSTGQASPVRPVDPNAETVVADAPSGGAEAHDEVDDPLIGRELGGCRIQRFLGKGGMATVYEAVQEGLDRTVAVKILSPELTKDPRQVNQFMREARTLARLEHPNIVNIYNVGNDGELYFIVMQFVKGGSLQELMDEGGLDGLDAVCDAVTQIGNGLARAHEKGIAHRDIKPENVLVAEGPTFKISDFGLALMESEAETHFGGGGIVGTPYYMSPEQIDGQEVDARTDIYALGGTFYYMLTGRHPFEADSPIDILVKHLNDPVVPPREHDSGIPEPLSNLICKMLVKDPDGRYQTVDDVLEDLDGARSGEATVEIELPEEEKEPAFSFSEEALPPMEDLLEPIKTVRPVSVYLLGGIFFLALGLAAALGSGPLMTVLAESRRAAERETSPRERMAEVAFRTTRSELEGLGAEKAIPRLRALADRYRGTAAAERAANEVERLQQEFEAEAKAAVEKQLELASSLEEDGSYGPALRLLAPESLDARFRDLPAAEALAEEAARIRDLLRQKGVVYVPAGPFVQGDDGEEGYTDGFYIGLREVTNAEYARFVAEGGGTPPTTWNGKNHPPEGSGELPVTGVTYEQAKACARFYDKRLPTAAEWEKAARGADGRRWPWGNDALLDACNWKSDAPTPPGTWPDDESPHGCLDMAGNVAEWTRAAPTDDTPVLKGGSYRTRHFQNTRPAYSYEGASPNEAHEGVGFRLAR